MAKSYSFLFKLFIAISILLTFVFHENQSFGPAYLFFIISSTGIIIFHGLSKNLSFSKWMLAGLLLVGAICLAKPKSFEYSQLYTVINFIMLMALYIITYNPPNMNAYNIIDRSLYFVLFATCIMSWLLSMRINDKIFFISAVGDVNYTAVFVFSLFLYANKKRYLSGIIFGIVFALLFTDSRSYLLMIILFYILRFIKTLDERAFFYDNPVRTRINRTFIMMVFLIAATAAFSFIWVYYISYSGYVAHREGINDDSNRMRFVSIVRGFQLLGEDRRLILWGYGNKLLDKLDIFDNEYTTFLGIRLVQPHNSLVSLLDKMGVVSGLIYIYGLSGLIAKTQSRDNVEYMIPYIVNAMVMHSFFERGWLVFWIFILLTPVKQGKWTLFGYNFQKIKIFKPFRRNRKYRADWISKR